MSSFHRSTVLILSCILLGANFHSRLTADEVSARDEAPALLDKATKWIEEKSQDRYGFTVLDVQVYANRELRIDDVTYDPDTTLMRIKGKISYKTGPTAAVKFEIPADFDIRYTISTREIEGVKFRFKNSYMDYTLDLTPLKDALEGDISKLTEYIPNFGLVTRKTTSEYDARKKEFQDKYGKENVYFASSDFVRWASPETAGKWVVLAVGSGGSATPAIVAEVKTQMRKEFTHILTWLETRAGAAAKAAVDSLLNGDPITLPNLKFIWQNVTYRSKVSVAGRDLPEAPPIGHAAFVLIWEESGKPSATFNPAPTTQVDDSQARPKWKLAARYALGPTGCRLVLVPTGGAADRAGLVVGDVITKANGKPVGAADASTDYLIREIKRLPNRSISLEVLSGTTTKTVSVDLDPVL